MAKKTNCTVHGKPMYRVRAQIGIDEHGRPVNKNFYGDGKREAEAKRDAYLERMNSNRVDTNQSFGQLARFYTYEIMVQSDLAPSTVDLYERQYTTKLKPASIMLRPIVSITSADLQLYLNQLSKGFIDGKPVKIVPSNIKNVSKYLKRLFKYLSQQGFCDNLMLNVTVPVIKKDCAIEPDEDEIVTFSEEEIFKIVSTPNPKHFLFSLALATGLREGELLALKYSDFSDGSVTVARQLNSHYAVDSDGYREYVTVVKKTKSTSSFRSVPIPPSVLTDLEEHRKMHMEEMLQKGYRTDYLFTSDSGKFIDKTNFRRAWKRHLKRAGVEYKKFHACRSTYCTILCKNGVPLETASRLMGHSDINVTARYYRMVSSSEKKDAASKIDHLFSGDKTPSGDQVATNE